MKEYSPVKLPVDLLDMAFFCSKAVITLPSKSEVAQRAQQFLDYWELNPYLVLDAFLKMSKVQEDAINVVS